MFKCKYFECRIHEMFHRCWHLGILIAAFGEQHFFGRDICVTIERVSQLAHKSCLDVVWQWLSTCGPYSSGHPVLPALECVDYLPYRLYLTPCDSHMLLPSRKCWIHRVELNKDIKAMVVQQSREFFAVGIQQPMCWWHVSLNSHGSYMQCHLLDRNRFHLNELQIGYHHTL